LPSTKFLKKSFFKPRRTVKVAGACGVYF